MIKNYLKIAWRNLTKNKIFSFINVFGLTTGLTCCFLISIYIIHELSYDSYHKNADRIYQLGNTVVMKGEQESWAYNPALMGQTMQTAFPEIEKTARLVKLLSDDKTLLQYNSGKTPVSFYETKGYLADTSFLNIFTYHFKEGNSVNALNGPGSVIISEDIAKKLFGSQSALNKVITIKSNTAGDNDFKVTGVFVPSVTPSHIDARFIMSIKGTSVEAASYKANLATDNIFYTYLMLSRGTNAAELEKKFPAFIEKYAGNDLRASGFYKKQFLIPLRKIHLYESIKGNVTEPISPKSLYILGSIALFILIIAVINFMNLSTARSAKRASEVGIRKVMGAGKSSLVAQFLGESVLVSVLAFIFAVAFTQAFLEFFSQIFNISIQLSAINYVWLFAGFFSLSVITGLMAGSYPAFYLSSFMPVKTLKNKSAGRSASVVLRKGLVVFQFIISVILIIATTVMISQMNYIKSKDLGFEKSQQVIIPLRTAAAKNLYTPLKEELSAIPSVISSSASRFYPGIFHFNNSFMYPEGENVNASQLVYMNTVDDEFIKTLNLKPVAGRMFSKQYPSDVYSKIIVNEELVRKMHFNSTNDALGKTIKHDWGGNSINYEIIGVVKDFHFSGFREQINPFAFQLSYDNDKSYVIAHIRTSDIGSSLKAIEAAWQKVNPSEPFEYTFLDDEFYKNYESESRLFTIVNIFTAIAIIISCLGLFGLTAFSSEQRTKEIGIRKVLGASEINIISLLSKDFLRLIILSILISIPAGWYVMNLWLEGFVYRVKVTWDIFALAAGSAIFIALVTISFQAIKAAIVNPVKSIKYE